MAYTATLGGGGWTVGPIVAGSTFSAHKNGVAQAIPTDVATKLTFSTVLFNPDTVVNSRWTPPAGPVLLIGAVYMVTGANYVQAVIYKNGAAYKWGGFVRSATPEASATVMVLDAASGTDYYELFIWHSTGTTQNVDGTAASTYFQGSTFRA